MKLSICLLLLYSTFALADAKSDQLVDFSKIKKILKNDMLAEEASKKKRKIDKKKRRRKKALMATYNTPTADKFWSFFSEYWLVQNVDILKWDFPGPDYGLGDGAREFFEHLGVEGKKIKILLLNTNAVTHFALPSDSDEYIFLLSLPFVRGLDLSKMEIYILLFEDYLRAEAGHLKRYATSSQLNNFLGKNFYKKKIKKEVLDNTAKKYSEMIFKTGFTFQQQYQVTKQMANFFKGRIKFWNGYSNLLRKIDTFLKSKKEYRQYLKIYPSPELQLGWLQSITKKN